MAQLNFDASSVEPSQPMELLPPGDYEVQIVKSEMRATRNGDGQFLWLEFEILSGMAKGRRLWEQLNLVNPNAQAQAIAQRQLSAICHAIGRLQVADSEELHFRPMIAVVKVEDDSRDKNVQPPSDRRKQNRISGFKAAGAARAGGFAQPARSVAVPAQAPAQAPRQAPPPPPAGNVPPWRRQG